jgi:hypothetical protein
LQWKKQKKKVDGNSAVPQEEEEGDGSNTAIAFFTVLCYIAAK